MGKKRQRDRERERERDKERDDVMMGHPHFLNTFFFTLFRKVPHRRKSVHSFFILLARTTIRKKRRRKDFDTP